MYLLDSDILIFLLRGHDRVAGNIDSHLADPKAISVISYGELLYGAGKSARPVENSARVRHIAAIMPVIDVTPAIMETFSDIRIRLDQTGRRVDDFDLVIAATALVMNYTLVTNNTRHFGHVPNLKLENWTK